MADRPLLERLGIAFLRRRHQHMAPVEQDDAIHILDEEEQRTLRGVERSMVIRAAIVGALSGVATAVAEVVAQRWYREGGSYLDNATYWGVVGGVSILATVTEVLLLYVDSLRSVHELTRGAGVPLFATEDEASDSRMLPLATALTRAAMELPNPPDASARIDVYRETSKLRLAIASLLYKLKVSVTNIVLKVVLRRLVGRSALKVYLEFVAAPVYAFWNGWVAWQVIREARLRAIGPSAARVLCTQLLEDDVGPAELTALYGAVASAVVRTHDLHPNLSALLDQMELHLGPPPADVDIDDSHSLLERLGALPSDSQDRVLQLLHVAAVLDGRITADERRLLDEAHTACGRKRHPRVARDMRRAFVRGQAITPRWLAQARGEVEAAVR